MTGKLGPNEHLIGKEGSRRLLATPALVLDLDAFDRNVSTMAAMSAGRKVKLRPHAKTHKSVEIARRQMAAGAIGVCCAKLSEALTLADHGLQHILITSPIVVPGKIDWVLDLNDRLDDLLLAVDSDVCIDLLQEALARRGGKPMRLLVDLGTGKNRTGAPTVERVAELGAKIATHPSLRVAGLQCYAGYVQHIVDCDAREGEARRATERIAAARDALTAAVGPLEIVSGGGTGTFDVDAEAGVFTDMQVGSYVFMDVEYNALIRRDGTAGPFRTSLFVQTTVISANVANRVTTDGGFKSFAMDGPRPVIHDGAPVGATYEFLGDEHGSIVYTESSNGLRVGDVVNCVTPHCDPTVNLYDFYHCVRGDRLVDIWPIEARGKTW